MTDTDAAGRRELTRQQAARNARLLSEYGADSMGMPTKTIRVPQALWDDAMDAARDADETLSNVIRAALLRYVKAQRKRSASKPG